MIQPKSVTIREVFSAGDVKIVIPPNQRSFDWGKEEVTELIEDLKNAQANDDTDLFLGNFIFDLTEQGFWKVVDGQQRLTTLSLVLIACRSVAKRIGNERLAQKVQEKLTFEDDTTATDMGTRLSVSPSIKEVFEYMCSYDWDESFPNVVGRKSVKRQSNKIRPIYQYVFEQIKDYSEEQLSSFLKSLYDAYVIQINIHDTQEAFDMFERTNARGLDLNVSDLVKNYLYSDEIEDVEDRWTLIVENSNNNLQRMLKYYYISRHGLVRKKDLYRNIKRHGRSVGGEILTEELVEFSSFYNVTQNLDRSDISEFLDDIGARSFAENESYVDITKRFLEALKLFKITQVYPVIYSILRSYVNCKDDLDRKNKKLIRLFKVIENYHFINNVIVDKVGNEVEKFYADIAKDFFVGNFMELAEIFENQLVSKLTTEEEFVANFSQLSYVSTPKALIHYVFDRFNNYKLKETQRVPIFSPDPIFIRRNFNIDHILPQSVRSKEGTDDFTLENLDNIGNLLVMSRHSNSGFQDMSPLEKIKELEKAEHSGRFVYIKEFLDKYKTKMDDWKGGDIVSRAEQMGEQGYEEVWAL